MTNLPAVLNYDLTKPEGLSEGLMAYAKQNPIQASALMVLSSFAVPSLLLGTAIGDGIKGLLARSEKVIEAQRKAAISVIQEGKASGAKKVRVTMNQKAGIDLGADLQGIPLKFMIGSDDQMTIEAEFA